MIVYMAHPVAPYDGRTVVDNLASARLWLRWCHLHLPAWTVIAPWIVECEIYDDADPAQRAASMARQLEVVRACDAILLVRAHISSGMRGEARAAWSQGKRVFYLPWPDPETCKVYPEEIATWGLCPRHGHWPPGLA